MKKIFFFTSLLITSNLLSQASYIHQMGILPGPDPYIDSVPQKAKFTRSFYQNIPKEFSLKKYSPIPESQEQYGTCVAWATAYSARTILEAQKYEWRDKNIITENTFSPGFQYRITSSRSDCWGAYIAEALLNMQRIGSVPNHRFVVTDGQKDCPTKPMPAINKKIAEQYRIDEVASLWTGGLSKQEKMERIKLSLFNGNPVIIAMKVPPSFDRVGHYNAEDEWVAGDVWIPQESPSKSYSGHAMVVVAYDDSKYGGAFQIQNSWGSDWGNGGYIWIRYQDFMNFVDEAFEVSQLEKENYNNFALSATLRLQNLESNKDLRVELDVKNDPQNLFQINYKATSPLFSGDRMRLYLTNRKPSYVYLLGTGSVDTDIEVLFPQERISPFLNYKNSEIAIPSEEYYFQMDTTTGIDYIIAIFSTEQLNIRQLSRKIYKAKGNLLQKIHTAIGRKFIKNQFTHLEKYGVDFKVKQINKHETTFAVVIAFEHKQPSTE